MKSEPASSVLIVEDEMIVAADLQRTLIDLGYDAFAIAASADEALQCAAERCPDVVLMDIRISGQRDGIAAATLLRTEFGVPIVFLTAHADDATIERAKAAEAYGYLVKPVRVVELRSAIEVAIYKHQMERRLRERERWFSTSLHSIADAVITVDLGGRVMFMNRAAENLTGVAVADALGAPVRSVLGLLDPAQVASRLDAVLAARLSNVTEPTPVKRSPGADRIISDTAAPVIDNGEMLGAVMVFRDVTEQKLMQRQLELGDRLTSLGTMAAGVAHEINNPLLVVMANASFALEEFGKLVHSIPPGDDSARLVEALQALRELESAGARVARIVADLQAFSRPPQRAVGEAPVGAAVEWAIRSTNTELRSRARVVTQLSAARSVKLDETRLGQILVNLMLNAAHAIAPGRYEANMVTITSRDQGADVVIEVRDTGAGMSPEVLERVFEPFFTTKAPGAGTGLGLSICHGMVISAGGRLDVQSVVGEGTTFQITLPAVSPVLEVVTAAPPVLVERRGRILIIDDDPAILKGMARVLRGHDIVAVESGRRALSMVDGGEAFDVIVSDMMMPEMSGMDLYEALLARHPHVASRMVFLTGGAVTARTADFLAVVPNRHLQKPLDVATLRSMIQRLLAEHAAPRAP